MSVFCQAVTIEYIVAFGFHSFLRAHGYLHRRLCLLQDGFVLFVSSLATVFIEREKLPSNVIPVTNYSRQCVLRLALQPKVFRT